MKKLILFYTSLIIFIIISFLVQFNLTDNFDLTIYNFIIGFKNDYLTNFLKVITIFGGEYIILTITFLFFFLKNKKFFLSLFIDMILIVLFNYLLKLFFLRERPVELMIINETGYSYPSGHSMIAVSFYGFIVYLIWNMNIKKIYKYLLSFLIVLLIILIGISRIYLGVHFPSDVIGGYSISLCFLIGYISIIRKRFVWKIYF